MKKILILLQLLLIVTINGCGNYKPIYSSKTHNFNIISIEVDENNRINSKIKNSLKIAFSRLVPAKVISKV